MPAGVFFERATVLELIQVADILPVNPDARGSLHFGGADELDLSHDIALCVGTSDEKEKETKNHRNQRSGFIRHSHHRSLVAPSSAFLLSHKNTMQSLLVLGMLNNR